MADKYINETGVAVIRDWVNGKFATAAALQTLADEVDDIIAEGGEPNVIETVKVNGTALTPDANKAVDITVPDSVATTSADGLMSSADKTKLDGVEAGADENVIETVKVNGRALTPDANKAVNVTYPGNMVTMNGDQLRTVELAAFDYSANINNIVFQSQDDGTGDESSAALHIYSGDPSDGSALDIDITVPSMNMMEAYVSSEGGKIDVIKVNGTAQTITNKEVNLSIPDSPATTSANGLMSSTDKTKLDGIEAGAKANVQSDWNQATTTADDYIKNKPTKLSDFTNDGDGTTGSTFPTTAEMNSAIGQAVSSAYVYKGSVATVADLPASGNTTGDVYDVQASGMNYAWNGTSWDPLGQYVDTSVLWTSTTGQSNTLEAMTVAEVNAILNPSTP